MADMYEETFENEFFITEGLSDEVSRYNKMKDGSDEKLNAAKALEIRHKRAIEEYEAGQKALDMAERRQIEREKLEFEREKAEQEATDRARQAKAEEKREKFRIGLAVGGFALTVVTQITGFRLDHGKKYADDLRNRNAESEAKDTHRALNSFVEKLLGK